MKKLYSFLLMTLLTGAAIAQSDFHLQINHHLGASPFQFGTAAMNNNSVQFNVSRLQYYISQITLIHDGAQETPVPGTWLLVDAGTAVNVPLGSHSITNLEGIRFGVGVESAVNHLDPSSYPSNHPLAPQSPSMHWGWSAGYRFAVIEGNSGASFSQTYQIHALEDDYYFLTTVSTTGITGPNGITIALDADYAMALYDIDVSTGPITHGGFGEAITLLENFRDRVFTPATALALDNGIGREAFEVFPNPAAASRVVRVRGEFDLGSVISVTDLSGRVIREIQPAGGQTDLEMSTPGFYMVSLKKDGQTVAGRKLIVTE